MCILNILKAAEFGYIVLLVVQEESKHVLDSTQLTGKVALWSELLTCCVKCPCIKDRPPLNIPQSGPRPATSCSTIPWLHTTHKTMYTGRYWYRINQYNGTLVQCYWKLFLFNISNRDTNIKAIFIYQGGLFTHIIYASSFLYRGNLNFCTIKREIKCTILTTRTIDKWFNIIDDIILGGF